MTMTVVFEDYEDMMNFAKKVMGQAVSSDNASQRPTAESILGITPETFTTASSLQVPVTPPVQQPAPVAPPVQQPAPAATVTPPVRMYLDPPVFQSPHKGWKDTSWPQP